MNTIRLAENDYIELIKREITQIQIEKNNEKRTREKYYIITPEKLLSLMIERDMLKKELKHSLEVAGEIEAEAYLAAAEGI